MTRKSFCTIILWVALIPLLASTQVSLAISLPAGFTSELFVGGLNYPTTITFAPDGRLFIGQKDGRVRVFQNGTLLGTDFINISSDVNNSADRGLLGIAVHPNFPNQPYIYLLYTYDPPGTVADGGGARVSRLIRLTADPAANYNTAVSNSAVVILGTNSVLANIGNPSSNDGVPSCENINGYIGYVPDCLPSDSPSHSIGTVAFGLDGALFVGNGDGAHYNYADQRALRVLETNSLSGKILRIDPITGQGYPDNPFYNGDPTSNQSKVYSLGLRNPFRFTVSPYNGEPYIGDVGWITWEEINTGRGANFGWPCYEGSDTGSAQQSGYANDSTTSVRCAQLYNQGLGAVQQPLHAYNHNGLGASVQAGAFYSGSAYPPQYQGALFYSDFNNDWIKYLTLTGSEPAGDVIRTPLAADDFNRASIGTNWTGNYSDQNASNANLGITGNRVRSTSTVVDATMTYNAVSLPDDQWAQITIPTLSTSSSSGARVLLRFGAAGSKNGYEMALARPGTNYYTSRIAKWTNGVFTSLAVENAIPWTAGDVLRGEVQGTTLRLYRNNTLVLSATDTTFSSGQAGITVYTNALEGLELDDFVAGEISGGGGGVVATPNDFAFDVSNGGPVQLLTGPDSNLYYVAYVYGTNTSEIRRIRYQSATNTPPIAKASAAPTSGLPPLTVNFSSGGSSDPDGDPITYGWNFGDGGTSTQANPSHTYGSTGAFTAILTVTDSKGASGTAQVTITAGNTKPTATILSPADGSKYTIGTAIVFQGRGTDPEQGTLTGASLVWDVLLHHNEHTHFDFYPKYYGETGSFVPVDHGDNTWLELCLTATDGGGLTDTKCVKLVPNATTLTFKTKPGGLQLVFDGVSRATPFSVTVPVNATREIIAPAIQGNRTFQSWSDGGAATHTIVVGSQPATYTATYTGRK